MDGHDKAPPAPENLRLSSKAGRRQRHKSDSDSDLYLTDGGEEDLPSGQAQEVPQASSSKAFGCDWQSLDNYGKERKKPKKAPKARKEEEQPRQSRRRQRDQDDQEDEVVRPAKVKRRRGRENDPEDLDDDDFESPPRRREKGIIQINS